MQSMGRKPKYQTVSEGSVMSMKFRSESMEFQRGPRSETVVRLVGGVRAAEPGPVPVQVGALGVPVEVGVQRAVHEVPDDVADHQREVHDVPGARQEVRDAREVPRSMRPRSVKARWCGLWAVWS